MNLLAWFETRIDPFRPGPPRDPPPNVVGLYWHYLRQIPVAGTALIVLGGVTPILEALLFVALGEAVTIMSGSAGGNPANRDVTPLFLTIPLLLAGSLASGGLYMMLSWLTLLAPFTSLIHWQAHRQVIRRPMSYFQSEASGRIGSQILEVGNTVRSSSMQAVGSLWFTLVFLISTSAVFIDLNWIFLVPLALWVAGYAATLWYFTPRVAKGGRTTNDAYSQLSGRVVDTYANVLTVKLFSGSDHEDAHVRDAITTMVDRNRELMRLYTVQWFALSGLDYVLIAAVFLTALGLWESQTLPVGAIVTATSLVLRLHSIGSMVVGGISGLAQAMGRIQNAMKAIAPEKPDPIRETNAQPPVTDGGVRFDQVAFAYPNGEKVLSSLTFSVPPRGSLGIVGLSGAGKSTIVNLLTGLFTPQAGSIAIGGDDIAAMSEARLLGSFSVVSQDPSLFNRSVRDNLRYGRPGANDSELIDALRAASAAEFVANLKDTQGRRGLDAVVGERGVRLSGGQRQRIAIARALLRDTPILVFDEPTSALDSETEASIQASLAALRRQKTVIVIAHRVSTVAGLDRIIVLDRGSVVEEGRHSDLIERRGVYFGFWQRQTAGDLRPDQRRETAAN